MKGHRREPHRGSATLPPHYCWEPSQYEGLIREMENSYLNGLDNYPRTITAAYNLLVNWKGDPGRQPRHVVSDGVAFTNNGVALVNPGCPKRDMATIDCRNCGEYGHYTTDCPRPKKQGQTGEQLLTAGMESGESDKEFTYDDKWDSFTFVTNGEPNTEPDSDSGAKADAFTTDDEWTMCNDNRINFVFVNNGAPQPRSVGAAFTVDKESRIPRSWILLDNQSTVDVFHNESLLKRTRVRKNGHKDIHCNAGVTSTNLVGDLPGYGTVWYHPKGIANILSLNKVEEKYLVTYNSRDGNAFVVHKDDGSLQTFQQSPRGLFYMGTAKTGTLLVNTVAENKNKYTNRDYSKALLA
jgi:hypothetical protein